MCDCDDCLGRTPYASLIATTVMCIGVGLFCGTGFRALDITQNGIFEGLFKFHVSWYVAVITLNFCFSCFMYIYWNKHGHVRYHGYSKKESKVLPKPCGPTEWHLP